MQASERAHEATDESNSRAEVLQVELGGYTTAGLKDRNEDAFAAKLPVSAGVVRYKGVVACIADGVSCSANAQQASQTSVTQFIEDYYSTPDSWSVKQSAARVLTSLNSWLFHHGQQGDLRHNGLVTTFSGLVLKSNTAHVIHAGDSRIFRFREGHLQQLTRDHSHRQYGQSSFLTRALGMDSFLEVDYRQVSLQVDDLLILTTDGVHSFVSQSAAEDLLQSESACRNLETLAKTLVERALTNGSDDNLSCLIVRIQALPEADVDEVHRQLTELVIPPVMSVGNRIDSYEVLKVIHSGTRSHLYLVEEQGSGRRLVLKAPSENFSEDPQYLEGFIREQWVGRRLNSPWVMKIYERPTDSPFLYHLCEYIEGRTLRQWMHDHPNPGFEQVRGLADQMVKGLRVMHRMGMVHRDLKPENVMITSQNKAILIDFGTVLVEGLEEIATPLREEIPVGSVDYIAPEYLRGERGRQSADTFSLGVIVYEMLTGKLPYKTSPAQQQNPQRYQDWSYRSARLQRKDIPLWMDLALEKACAESVLQRYPAMSEFLQDLTTPNTLLMSEYHSAPLMRRNPLLFWQCMAAVLFAMVLVEGWLLSR